MWTYVQPTNKLFFYEYLGLNSTFSLAWDTKVCLLTKFSVCLLGGTNTLLAVTITDGRVVIKRSFHESGLKYHLNISEFTLVHGLMWALNDLKPKHCCHGRLPPIFSPRQNANHLQRGSFSVRVPALSTQSMIFFHQTIIYWFADFH